MIDPHALIAGGCAALALAGLIDALIRRATR